MLKYRQDFKNIQEYLLEYPLLINIFQEHSHTLTKKLQAV